MTEHLWQDYDVYRDGDVFRVRGQIDGVEKKASDRACQAIQFAIDSLAGSGGEVALQRGVFPLERSVSLANDVWLRGSGRATKLLVAKAHETGIGLLCEGLKGAVISDLAVQTEEDQAAVAGIVIDDCGDCQVRDVFCQGFALYGIWVRNNSFLCEINSCKLANNGKANIYLDHLTKGGRGGDFVPNLLANCITYAGGMGIECYEVMELNITGCAVFQPGEFAYYLHDMSNNVLISGCHSFQVEKHAVVVESTHEVNISSNCFSWHRGHGIVLKNVSWGAINGNEINDQGVQARDGSHMIGVLMTSGTQGVQVVGNTIFNWGDQRPMRIGIKEDGSCRKNAIVGNNINYCTEADVVSEGEGTLVDNNVSEVKESLLYMDQPKFPDFTRERIERFIRE